MRVASFTAAHDLDGLDSDLRPTGVNGDALLLHEDVAVFGAQMLVALEQLHLPPSQLLQV